MNVIFNGAKFVVSGLSAIGADLIVADVLVKVMPATVSSIGKAARIVAGSALGAGAGMVTSAIVEKTFDEADKMLEEIKTNIENAKTKKEEAKKPAEEEDENILRAKYEELKARFEEAKE